MRRRAPFAWLVVGVLALAGCSEPQQANDTLPTAPATTSAEPTLEPLGPADFPVPDEAREQTLGGAVAMASYYFSLLNYSQAVPTGQWLRVVSMNCVVCSSTADYFDASATSGVTFEGGTFSLVSSGGELLSNAEASIATRVELQAVQAFDANGQPIAAESFDASTFSGGLLMSWNTVDAAWVVTQVDLSAV